MTRDSALYQILALLEVRKVQAVRQPRMDSLMLSFSPRLLEGGKKLGFRLVGVCDDVVPA